MLLLKGGSQFSCGPEWGCGVKNPLKKGEIHRQKGTKLDLECNFTFLLTYFMEKFWTSCLW